MAEKTVRACPVCGEPAFSHCYHDNEDVLSIDMPLIDSIELMVRSIQHFQDEQQRFHDGIARLLAKMKEGGE